MRIFDLPEDLQLPEAFDLNIDPQSELYQRVAPMCDPTNPSKCLVASLGYVQSHGHRTSLTFKHTPDGPKDAKLRVSLGGGYSAVKRGGKVPRGLLKVAERFDNGQTIKRAATGHIDLTDGTWDFEYKESTGGAKTPANNQGRGTQNKLIKSLRARTLADVRKTAVVGAQAASPE